MEAKHLNSTAILDFDHPALTSLIRERGWDGLAESERIGAIYDFVRNEIGFGYNVSDEIPASAVLADGYAQCNTKTTLLMALLRGTGIPCRFHGATIHKRLQKGVVDGFFYRVAPDDILHSWTEVEFEGRWVGLEGVILDAGYLEGLRAGVASGGGAFLGYGAGTEDISDPPITWNGTDTEIQATGVNNDFGVFDDPDEFYRQRGTNLTGLRGMLFRLVIRRVMNRKVDSIRSCAVAPRPVDPSGAMSPRRI